MSNQKEYIVPKNFNDSGKILGLFYIRNLVEAILLPFVLYTLETELFHTIFHLPENAYMLILLLTTIPLGIIAFIGVKNEPLTAYLAAKLHHSCTACRYRIRIPNRIDMTLTEQPELSKDIPKRNLFITRYVSPVFQKLKEFYEKAKAAM